MYYIYTPSRQLGLTRSHFCKRYAVNPCDTVAFCAVLYDGRCDGWSYRIRSESLWVCVGCTRQYHVWGTVWSLRHPTRVYEDLQRKYYIGRIKTIIQPYGQKILPSVRPVIKLRTNCQRLIHDERLCKILEVQKFIVTINRT